MVLPPQHPSLFFPPFLLRPVQRKNITNMIKMDKIGLDYKRGLFKHTSGVSEDS